MTKTVVIGFWFLAGFLNFPLFLTILPVFSYIMVFWFTWFLRFFHLGGLKDSLEMQVEDKRFRTYKLDRLL